MSYKHEAFSLIEGDRDGTAQVQYMSFLSFHVTSTEGEGTVQVQNVYGMGCRRARKSSWGGVDKGLRALSIKIKACVTPEEHMLLVG